VYQHIMTIYDLEDLQNTAEYIITSAQYAFVNYDVEGNYLLDMSQEERHKKMRAWIDNLASLPLCFREYEEIKKLAFYDVLEMPLSEIKEKYLKNYLYTLRQIFRKGTMDLGFVPSDDIPDEYLDDLLALRYRENLKLWTMRWDTIKNMEEENDD